MKSTINRARGFWILLRSFRATTIGHEKPTPERFAAGLGGEISDRLHNLWPGNHLDRESIGNLAVAEDVDVLGEGELLREVIDDRSGCTVLRKAVLLHERAHLRYECLDIDATSRHSPRTGHVGKQCPMPSIGALPRLPERPEQPSTLASIRHHALDLASQLVVCIFDVQVTAVTGLREFRGMSLVLRSGERPRTMFELHCDPVHTKSDRLGQMPFRSLHRFAPPALCANMCETGRHRA